MNRAGQPVLRCATLLPPQSCWWKFSFCALHAVASVLTIGGSNVARADVLYDTTWMTDKGLYNETMSGYIGGLGAQAFFVDSQTADDFELADAHVITSVTGDFFTLQPGFVPADGILIEIFEDLDGFPSEIRTAAVFSSNYEMTPFPDIVWDSLVGRRFTVDLSEEGITLDPGTWWVSFVPVDLSPDGADYRQLRKLNLLNGNPAHLRDGGIDHGNGYPGFFGFPDWTPFDQFGGSTSGDLAMRIAGAPVKPACPWDLDDNGSVGASDLLSLLVSWGPCKGCPADFNGDNTIGSSDLLALLVNWGPCP